MEHTPYWYLGHSERGGTRSPLTTPTMRLLSEGHATIGKWKRNDMAKMHAPHDPPHTHTHTHSLSTSTCLHQPTTNNDQNTVTRFITPIYSEHLCPNCHFSKMEPRQHFSTEMTICDVHSRSRWTDKCIPGTSRDFKVEQ